MNGYVVFRLFDLASTETVACAQVAVVHLRDGDSADAVVDSLVEQYCLPDRCRVRLCKVLLAQVDKFVSAHVAGQ